jgi:methionine-S-sulfoxide reductase
VGYAGGTTRNPSYHNLGDHTETLQVDFDPARVRYEDLLAVFWDAHSPASRSWSRQYRAALFYHTDEQRRIADASKERKAVELGSRIHTEVLPATPFTLAEDYHQKYYLRQNRPLLREVRTAYATEAEFVASTAAARLNGYAGGYGSLQQLEDEIESLGLSREAGRALRASVARRPR